MSGLKEKCTAAQTKIVPQVKKMRGRWQEKVLHVPSDLAVMVGAIAMLANAGAIALIAVVVLALLGAFLFSA